MAESQSPVQKSFVEFIGIYKEPPQDSFYLPAPICVRQGFEVEHREKEDLAFFINKAFQELAMLGGMLTHKKEPHERWDFSNQVFIPMHMFSRIECSVKRITAVPENPDALDPKETVN